MFRLHVCVCGRARICLHVLVVAITKYTFRLFIHFPQRELLRRSHQQTQATPVWHYVRTLPREILKTGIIVPGNGKQSQRWRWGLFGRRRVRVNTLDLNDSAIHCSRACPRSLLLQARPEGGCLNTGC